MARTSAVTVELGTIVEIHLTPRLNPGHDPGTNWRICLPEPIAIGGRLHASNRFLATFYHGVYPGSGLPNRCAGRSANRLWFRTKKTSSKGEA